MATTDMFTIGERLSCSETGLFGYPQGMVLDSTSLIICPLYPLLHTVGPLYRKYNFQNLIPEKYLCILHRVVPNRPLHICEAMQQRRENRRYSSHALSSLALFTMTSPRKNVQVNGQSPMTAWPPFYNRSTVPDPRSSSRVSIDFCFTAARTAAHPSGLPFHVHFQQGSKQSNENKCQVK